MPLQPDQPSSREVTFARLRAVRRFLIFVLVALLPLQFSWAAVAAYCQHEAESSTQARHFGHHEHHHGHGAVGQAGPSVDGDTTKKAGDGPLLKASDPDCAHCHGVGASLLGAWAVVPLPRPSGVAPADTTHAIPPWATAPPDRPQWHRLA